MPAKTRPGKSNLYVHVPTPLYDSFVRFAVQRGHTLTREVEEAMRRHLLDPPLEPNVPETVVPEPEPVQPKRPVGRPRKPVPDGEAKPKRPVGRPRKDAGK